MAVPEFPTAQAPPPPQPRSRGTAVTLALLLGPFGLMYTNIGAGLFMLFVMITLGLFTVGMGVIPVWLLSVAWAWLANHDDTAASALRHPPAVDAERSFATGARVCPGVDPSQPRVGGGSPQPAQESQRDS